MANLISVSRPPIAGYGDKECCDLLDTLEVMRTIFRESVVDGFELQPEPEWAALYGELDSFESIVNTIVNVHIRGKLQGGRWFMDRSSFRFYEALDTIRRKWKYTGLLTMEPEGMINASFMEDFLKAMHSLRKPRVSH